MNEDLQNNTKKVMSLVVAIVLLVAGAYFIKYAPENGKFAGIDFNLLMGSLFVVYGLFRAYLLFKSVKE
jgi:uncharacterized membrane protein